MSCSDIIRFGRVVKKIIPNRRILISLLVFQILLLGYSSLTHSPALDEVGHLAAGIYCWEHKQFDVYRVNPPLVREVAAIPAVLNSASQPWERYSRGIITRPEWNLGRDFIEKNPNTWKWYFISARWILIPFQLLGSFVCYLWATKLFGKDSGLIVLILWCFSPNLLAWGATITPDATSASMGVLAGYSYWKWLREPNWQHALFAGLSLGLAELTKTTWIVLFGLWPILWLFWQYLETKNSNSISVSTKLKQLIFILFLGVYLLNLGYGFIGSLQKVKNYQFASRTFAGPNSITDGGNGGNIFAKSWIGEIPLPVPSDYLSGIDLQKLDFERGSWSYLNGEWKANGWWYYYIVAVLLKVPTGILLLSLLALFLSISRFKFLHFDWKSEIVLIAPAIVIFVLVSSQTGFSIYLRYILPCFPFVFIWISKVGLILCQKNKLLLMTLYFSLVWFVVSSLWVYPHSMSYFNELAGGPTKGYRYLLDANIDWGQDLFYLKKWYDDHPDARPLFLDCHTSISPQKFGISSELPPQGFDRTENEDPLPLSELKNKGPRPGWYALSVHILNNRKGSYNYLLQHFKPVTTIGYSIYIYDIKLDEANQVRRIMGLPELRE
ncbi:hypothetical protein V6x_51410 [Gimesia chilikensis]|uniref:Glycosyltransferase RgtA/B/C/D-like domain-containing protein n=1 Tax=Gimesia chilikensis TaxID=2605989 RepID=A0A517WJH1_9PLAN|nr:glycosyltransferase family 39 protein [Gimesia chilikensis]QDU05404.1 hypothetical protein V6x_51410 [Gimesia chilikensis]